MMYFTLRLYVALLRSGSGLGEVGLSVRAGHRGLFDDGDRGVVLAEHDVAERAALMISRGGDGLRGRGGASSKARAADATTRAATLAPSINFRLVITESSVGVSIRPHIGPQCGSGGPFAKGGRAVRHFVVIPAYRRLTAAAKRPARRGAPRLVPGVSGGFDARRLGRRRASSHRPPWLWARQLRLPELSIPADRLPAEEAIDPPQDHPYWCWISIAMGLSTRTQGGGSAGAPQVSRGHAA